MKTIEQVRVGLNKIFKVIEVLQSPAYHKEPFVQQVSNIVIGGSAALILHGLNLPRGCSDIDLIIYSPTKEQLDVIKILGIETSLNDSFGYAGKRVSKLSRDGIKIDIIVAETTPVPENLSFIMLNFSLLKIQSVQGVIDAKNSYSQERESQLYIRGKDLIDLIELKNNNFNLKA